MDDRPDRRPDLKAMREEIRRLLPERRPDRYTIDGNDEDTPSNAWLDDIAEEVAGLAPEDEVRRVLARKVVGDEEGRATRRANDLLRRVHRTGQLPLDWLDAKDWPLAVTTTYRDEDGERKTLDERVALRAATSADFRAFANDERARAARDFTARNDACEGAEWVADQMDEDGAITFKDWAKS